MPTSAIASRTAGLIASAGADPAERTLDPAGGVVGEQGGGHL